MATAIARNVILPDVEIERDDAADAVPAHKRKASAVSFSSLGYGAAASQTKGGMAVRLPSARAKEVALAQLHPELLPPPARKEEPTEIEPYVVIDMDDGFSEEVESVSETDDVSAAPRVDQAVAVAAAAAAATRVKPTYEVHSLVLPEGPSDAEKVSYLKTNRLVLYSFGTFSVCSMTVGMLLFCKTSPYFYPFFIWVALVFWYLMASYLLIGVRGKDYEYEAHKKLVEEQKDFLPSVDILLPCCGEPLELLDNTWHHVSKLEYDGVLKFWVLDDKHCDQTKELAEYYNFNYVRRADRPHLKKAGNLRNAFKITTGELFVIYDADFCPRADFLKEVVPQFSDPEIALVQTPQFFRMRKEQTWVEKGAGVTQELFYRLIQMNRDHYRAAICVGTCGTYRRKALEPMGGTAPIEHSEDVFTGVSCVKDGQWRLKYVPLNLAMGTCPDKLPSFFTQQYRWASGSTTLASKGWFWTSKLSWIQKMCFLSGMAYYSITAMEVVISQLPGMLLIWVKPDAVFWLNCVFIIPSFLMASIGMWLWCTQPYLYYVGLVKVAQYYAHMFAVADKILGTTQGWVPTGTVKKKSNIGRFMQARIAAAVNVGTIFTLTVVGSAYQISRGFVWWQFIPGLLLLCQFTYVHIPFIFNLC